MPWHIFYYFHFNFIIRSTFSGYLGGKVNVRIETLKKSDKSHKMWLLQSCKKVLHISQIDVKSENRVSANSLIPNFIYF